MNWTTVQDNWAAYVPRLMTRWPDLSENDLLATDGQMDAVAAHLATVEDTTPIDARDMLTTWMRGSEPADAIMDDTRDNARISESARDMAVGEDAFSDDAKFGSEDAPKNPMGRT